MYFKKLELSGFKSFAEKMTFHFEPGITAIVGPNGCGKSNIFDSIRWVLGEQSEKSLRSSKMEDVIFNGTENTSSLGFTEVSLTFSNEKKFLLIEYDEVTVTRRLFRSGESEYLINNTPVRLKDILDLFYGTGIGAESYSLIEQGKVDLILSSKPEDRRLIFEEAAGITKYKSDKKETLRKLKDTENNLLRINDIISEVKRQIISLERQAEKAKKYKELFEKLKELEIRKASHDIQKLRNEKEILNRNVLDLEDKSNSIESEIKSDSFLLQEMYKELESKESEINSLREDIVSCENKISNNNHLISMNEERMKELNQRVLELEEDKRTICESISKIKQSIEKKRENLKNINLFFQEKKKELRDKEENFNLIEERIKKTQKDILESKKKIFEVLTEFTELKNQMNEIKASLQGLLARKKRLEIEREKIDQELIPSEERKNSVLKEIDSINSQLKDLYNLNQKDKEELEKEKSEIFTFDEKIKELEKEISGYISQREFLKELKLKYEEIPLKQEGMFLLKESPESSSKIIVAKIESIEETDKEIKELFFDFNFKINCEIKPLYQDESILEEKIKERGKNLEGVLKEKERKSEKIQRIIENIKDRESKIHKIEIEKTNYESQRNQVEEESKRLENEIELIDLESEQTNRDLENLREKEFELEKRILSKEKEKQDLEKNIEEGQNLITLISQQKEENLIISTQLKTEIDSLEDKISSEEDTIKILEDSYLKDCQDLEKKEREKEQNSKRVSELQIQSKELSSEIEIFEEKKEEFKKLLESKQTDYLGLKDKIKEKEEISNQKNRIKEDLINRIHEFNLKIQEIEFNEKSIRERIQQIYRTEIEEIIEEKDSENIIIEIENLKKKLDSFGEVSLGSIEEYNELKSRYEFLIQQREDLIQAKDSLETAIKKINYLTRKMFLDTFKNVVIEFKDYFKQLFGGGDAQLFLIDESDPLESGIEIACRPPGKKLQNILLLSGGEKALVAIALLFAIFKVKPSPFCILDEIDAALDEANINRFSQLLKEFSTKSQFIVITHNKRTIANSNVIYGITMEKSGISKVVSVKFAGEPIEV